MADEWTAGKTPVGGSGASGFSDGQEASVQGTAGAAAEGGAGSYTPAEAGGYGPVSGAANPVPPGGIGSSPTAGQGPTGWAPVGGVYPPSPGGVPLPGSAQANPVAAGLLGLIPGVGAMYNGQYAKGIVHLLIFAVLVSLSDNVNGVFGIFVAAWIFYQAFEAYHTARARLEGLPLPDPFGWNDIGERLGFGRNWPGSASRPAGTPVADWRPWGMPGGVPSGASGTTGPISPAPGQQVPGPGYENQGTPGAGWSDPYAGRQWGPSSNWAGYVSPAAFAGSPPPPPPVSGTISSAGAAPDPSAAPMPGQSMPYAPVSTGPYSGTPYPPTDPALSQRRFPVGAIWLIGLGVLFLLGQWTPLLRLSHEWVPSVLLAAFAVWLFARRMGWTGMVDAQRVAAVPEGLRLAYAVRAPGMLLAVAVLMGLQAAGVVWMSRSWPWLLIVFGGLLLAERLLSRAPLPESRGDDATQKGGR